jgi:hypothetical protein
MPSTRVRILARQRSDGRARIPFPAMIAALFTLSGALHAEDVVNPHAKALMKFQDRVEAYLALHKTAEAQLPALKTTDSSADITTHQHLLADKIRKQRGNAGQGTIFSPDVSKEFRRLAAVPLQGIDGGRVHKSLKRAEPVVARLEANTPYPENLPLQSIPPTLLENLPKVPPEVDYRIVGHALILRDVAANLIVDYVPDAIP